MQKSFETKFLRFTKTLYLNRCNRISISGFHSSSSLLRGTKNLDWLRRTTARLERIASESKVPVFPSEPLHGRKRARAFFDIGLGESESPQKEGGAGTNSNNSNPSSSLAVAGSGSASLPSKVGSGISVNKSVISDRIVFELADDIVPVSSENFLRLCERPQGAGYAKSELFKVQKGFAIFGGDFELNNGRGGRCAVGGEGERFFPDENFIGRHSFPGVLGMGNSGVHTNSSIFYVTLTDCPHLDGRNVVIGRVILGLDVLRRISNTFCVDFKPASPLVIHSCGRVLEGSPEWKKIDDQIKSEEKKASASASASAASAASAAVTSKKHTKDVTNLNTVPKK
jgi:cyclophilin family peptidyl-prolyl cis-trans isomerase